MVSLKCWKRDGQTFTITLPNYSQAFDKAMELGAVRAIDGLNGIYRLIECEWVYICQEKENHRTATKKA